jgi:hypothetical protein
MDRNTTRAWSVTELADRDEVGMRNRDRDEDGDGGRHAYFPVLEMPAEDGCCGGENLFVDGEDLVPELHGCVGEVAGLEESGAC